MISNDNGAVGLEEGVDILLVLNNCRQNEAKVNIRSNVSTNHDVFDVCHNQP